MTKERMNPVVGTQSCSRNSLKNPQFWAEVWNEAHRYSYTSGYYPSFQTWEDEWDEDLPVAEAAARLEEFFGLYTDVTPEVKKTIAGYVEQGAVNGVYREEYRMRLGMILWSGGEKR